ncbi:MAG: DNA polymerase III subunit chi [Magnetococcales bacterium]|nr:DNA polymerase III subunit chi [Magnetococcales bacterium]
MARTDPNKPTTVRFYQLGLSSLEAAVTGILTKAWEKGMRATLLTPGPDPTRYWDSLLWRTPADNFLPHGPDNGPDPDRQPILIASSLNDQNGATLVVLATPQLIEEPANYDMVVDFVDGSSQEDLAASRKRYKQYRELGCHLEYWVQEPNRGWSLKNSTEATQG